ncbi:hypothetical protein [Escherichia coli]|uniref:hypothetical protein n=1 Tax=Escherichia coli TaxID=562 RepID=UPI000B7F42F4|nr:hypothetical protein [Escherichia coli]
MTTQITIRNKQADNLLIYIEKYKAKFEERLVAYNAVGQLEWNAGSWRFGEKGVAWLKETLITLIFLKMMGPVSLSKSMYRDIT